MEIIAIIEPLFNDLQEIGFHKILKSNDFIRITNKTGLTHFYSIAQNENLEEAKPYDFLGLSTFSEQGLLAKFLNLLMGESLEFFCQKVTELLESTIPLLGYIPSINPILADLESIEISEIYKERIFNAWSKRSLDYKFKVDYFVNLLIIRSQNSSVKEEHYAILRKEFLGHEVLCHNLPEFVKEHEDMYGFWQFIKGQGGYRDRRFFLTSALQGLISAGEGLGVVLAEDLLSRFQTQIDIKYVNENWSKALKRLSNDPDGAITSARSLIETVCKHILGELNISYDDNLELPKLYKQPASNLKLSPELYTEPVFKQILSGCFSVVEGLGSLRNKHSDAHGIHSRKIKPSARHAELAVNLSGSMSKFLLETFLSQKNATA